MLVLHYTGMPEARAALARLADPVAKVSAHWLIDEEGMVHALVAEERRAWHAGISAWAGRSGLNDVSIGIELANPGHEWGYRPFPAPQMRALVELAAAILGRWPIPPGRIVAHADIAPHRKEDPGELFDWRLLARAGIGLWPEPDGAREPVDPLRARRLLGKIGYEVSQPSVTFAQLVTAFQRRWRQARVDGALDPETMARMAAVALAVGRDPD